MQNSKLHMLYIMPIHTVPLFQKNDFLIMSTIAITVAKYNIMYGMPCYPIGLSKATGIMSTLYSNHPRMFVCHVNYHILRDKPQSCHAVSFPHPQSSQCKHHVMADWTSSSKPWHGSPRKKASTEKFKERFWHKRFLIWSPGVLHQDQCTPTIPSVSQLTSRMKPD